MNCSDRLSVVDDRSGDHMRDTNEKSDGSEHELIDIVVHTTKQKVENDNDVTFTLLEDAGHSDRKLKMSATIHAEENASNEHERSVNDKKIFNESISLWYGLMLCIFFCSLVDSMILLTIWCIIAGHHRPAMFSSAPIGGTFTQFQAKAIDFGVDVITTPVSVAFMNLCWFDLARITAFNDFRTRSVKRIHLAALAELTETKSRFSSVFKTWIFLRTRYLRIIFFSIRVFLSAVSMAMFAKVIAYDAFQAQGEISALKGPQMNYLRHDNLFLDQASTSGGEPFSSDVCDQAQLATRFTDTLNNLNFGQFPPSEGDFTYGNAEIVKLNATEKSIAAIDDNVTTLYNVPAFKQSIDCKPTNTDSLNFLDKRDAGFSLNILVDGVGQYYGQICLCAHSYD